MSARVAMCVFSQSHLRHATFCTAGGKRKMAIAIESAESIPHEFVNMACPYFIPEQRCDSDLWQHRARLPLGDGFTGYCCAQSDAYRPSTDELRELCNIGYAKACPRLPEQRDADSVRFMARDGRVNGGRVNGAAVNNGEGLVTIKYLLELGHAPVSHGELRYDPAKAQWSAPHPDARVQTKAQCYLESYLARHPGQAYAKTTTAK